MANWLPLWVTRSLGALTLPAQILLTIWLLTMISVPILTWLWGERAQRRGIVAGVLLQAATVLAIVLPTWGVVRTGLTALLVVVTGWAAEFLGSSTGFPFGRYHYTDRLQPQLKGVPLVIPLAWLVMLPPALAVGAAIGGGAPLPTILASGLAFTAWDLFLDPQMVAWGMWVWEKAPRPATYFGIPWSNYAGWFAVAALMAGALLATTISPGAITTVTAPLLLIYGLTWFLETFGQLFFWGLSGPATAGGLGMGLCLLWALARHGIV